MPSKLRAAIVIAILLALTAGAVVFVMREKKKEDAVLTDQEKLAAQQKLMLDQQASLMAASGYGPSAVAPSYYAPSAAMMQAAPMEAHEVAPMVASTGGGASAVTYSQFRSEDSEQVGMPSSDDAFHASAACVGASGITFSSFPSAGDHQQQQWMGSTTEVDRLMPPSWRKGGAAAESACGDEWSKHLPTKAQFANYMSSGASSRMVQSDRQNVPSRLIGADWSGRPKPCVPVSRGNIGFGDSSFRMDAAAAACAPPAPVCF
jgi:hypothetical protein